MATICLGRLTSAATPEANNNARSFSYSNSGALCAGDPSAVCIRTDERGITTTYAYDALNRLTSKSYSDGTPTASFAYDETTATLGSWTSPTLAYPKGRLTHTATTSGSTLLSATIQDYDLMGRPVHYWQCTPLWVCGSFEGQYSYDLAGDLQSWSSPADFSFTNTISGAQRITAITSAGNGAAIPESLVPAVHYTPWGAIQTLQEGCVDTGCPTVQETYDYNSRMQPARIQLGTQSNESADYCLVYNYYTDVSNPNSCAVPGSGSHNNGNIMGSWYLDNYTPGFSQTVTNTYDNVNRLTNATATNNNNYNLSFSYDQYGNMTCVINGSTNGPCPTYTFNSAYNQISGYTYDAAGNLTNDTTYSLPVGRGRAVEPVVAGHEFHAPVHLQCPEPTRARHSRGFAQPGAGLCVCSHGGNGGRHLFRSRRSHVVAHHGAGVGAAAGGCGWLVRTGDGDPALRRPGHRHHRHQRHAKQRVPGYAVLPLGTDWGGQWRVGHGRLRGAV